MLLAKKKSQYSRNGYHRLLRRRTTLPKVQEKGGTEILRYQNLMAVVVPLLQPPPESPPITPPAAGAKSPCPGRRSHIPHAARRHRSSTSPTTPSLSPASLPLVEAFDPKLPLSEALTAPELLVHRPCFPPSRV